MPDSDHNGPGETKEQLSYVGRRQAFGGGDLAAPLKEEKLAALMSYLLGWITGLIFYFAGKSKYVKFHALQSIITFGAITVFQLVIWLIREVLAMFLRSPGSIYPVLNMHGMISAVVWVGSLIIWAFLMSKAYQGESYYLPVVGEVADKGAG